MRPRTGFLATSATCKEWILSLCGSAVPQRVRIVLTEKEMSALDSCLQRMPQVGKQQIAEASLTAVALQLWPSGSLEDMALRWLAPVLLANHYSRTGESPSLTERMRSFWSRDPIAWSRLSYESITASDPPATTSPSPDLPPTNPEPPTSGTESLDPRSSATPVDPPTARLLAMETNDPITSVENVGAAFITSASPVPLYSGITGVNAAGGKEIGVRIGPSTQMPELWARTALTMATTLHERVTKKKTKFRATKQDRLEAKWYMDEMLRLVFSQERMEEALLQITYDDSTKPRKWSSQRFEDAFLIAMNTAAKLEYKITTKIEGLPVGKSARPIIACGDVGQVMMKLVVAIWEICYFEYFHPAHIKHVSKREALARITRYLRSNRTGAVGLVGSSIPMEGDGSAWDVTMSLPLRTMFENPVIIHIVQFLRNNPVWTVPHAWLYEFELQIQAKKRKVKFVSVTGAMIHIVIENFRASGDPFTSIGNNQMNRGVWDGCLYGKNASKMLVKDKRGVLACTAVDRWGEIRWTKKAYEGDDSALNTNAKTPITAHEDDILAWMVRHGIRMKLKFPGASMEFCGWYLEVDELGPTGHFIPDVGRALTNSAITVSGEAISGTEETRRQIAAASHLARAHDFAGLSPTISTMYTRWSSQHVNNFERITDKELFYWVGYMSEDKHDIGGLVDEIGRWNAESSYADPVAELAFLRRFGYKISEEEWMNFITALPDVGTPDEEFRRIVPPAWL